MGHRHGWLRLLPARPVPALLTAIAAMPPSALPAQSISRAIELGEVRTINSSILDEDREVQVVLPETYERTTVSYPVLFVLDGGSHLLHAAATTRFLARARNRIPEMIVVAIPNTNRNRDMTPGPGAATFQRVLAEEIIPWVEQNYRAAPERLLVGHSLSASFAVHTLLNRPELFAAYIAASAPLWRYDGLSMDMSHGLPRAAKAKASVYLSVGEYENARLRDGVARFAASLARIDPGSAPNWAYTDMKGEDHSSTPQRSLYNALEARYADWRFPFFDSQAELDSAGGQAGLEAHYERFSSHFGYRIPVPEERVLQVGRIYLEAERYSDVRKLAASSAAHYPSLAEALVNEIGYDQLRRGQLERALETFQLNSAAFPESPSVHDGLGDAYCRAGNAAAGRESYQRAAHLAGTRSPPHPRTERYQEKAREGCARAG